MLITVIVIGNLVALVIGLIMGGLVVRRWLSHEWLMLARRRLALDSRAAHLARANSQCVCAPYDPILWGQGLKGRPSSTP